MTVAEHTQLIDVDDVAREVAREIDERFGAFLRRRVNPGAAARDEAHEALSRALFREAGEIGLLAYGLPREFGGVAPNRLRYGLAIEHLGYLCEDAALPIMLVFRSAVIKGIIDSGNASLVERYARPMARGELFPAFCFTEDAEPTNFKTVAHERPDGSFVVTGVKRPVMGGETADVAAVYCRKPDGDVACVLVETTDPGVRMIPIKVGALRSNGPCILELSNVVVPRERVLAACDGLSHAQENLNIRRLEIAIGMLGRMRALFENCVRALARTQRFGAPLTEMPIVQAHLGRMHVALLSAQSLAHTALQRADRTCDPYWEPVTTAAKYFVAEQANKLILEAFRPLATHGYIDPAFTRFQRDFAMLLTVSATQDSSEVNLGAWAARQVLAEDRRRAAAAPARPAPVRRKAGLSETAHAWLHKAR